MKKNCNNKKETLDSRYIDTNDEDNVEPRRIFS